MQVLLICNETGKLWKVDWSAPSKWLLFIGLGPLSWNSVKMSANLQARGYPARLVFIAVPDRSYRLFGMHKLSSLFITDVHAI